jgi:hypothetical protein
MKKFFFFFAMLAGIAASAQNVQVERIGATYTSTPTVKFRVAWTGARTYKHNTKVWVFVDYIPVAGHTPAGTWTRALVASTPTVSSSPASTATLEAGNNKGFWLYGVDGNYSATVTVSLTIAADVAQFNWCAYASDYPPNVVIHGNSSYTLHGSRPFVVNDVTLPVNQTTYSGTIISFTDATGAPGLFPAASGEKANGMGCVAGLMEHLSGVCAEPSTVGCNNGVLNLGPTSFTAGTEVTIVGNGISQIWSRPVTATGCQKTTYNAGTSGSYNADCRANPNNAGDYFSQCAVAQYAETICPPPWRVPLAADFENLFAAFGENSTPVYGLTFIQEKLINIWKGEWNHYCWGPEQGLGIGMQKGAYASGTNGTNLKFVGVTTDVDRQEQAAPAWGIAKVYGHTVRCVR